MSPRYYFALLVLVFAFAASVRTSAQAATPPAIYNLGTFGGLYSYGCGINASGQVVGYSDLTDRVHYHAFRYSGTPGSGGSMADLGYLVGGGKLSYGWAINASGQVAGESLAAGGGPGGWHACLYTGTPGSDGAMADLGTLPGLTTSEGMAINASGQVTGNSDLTDGLHSHAFLYTGTPGSGGSMADLGTIYNLGGDTSRGIGINASGQVTGFSSVGSNIGGDAFLYTGTPGSGGAMADLGTLGGHMSEGYAINDSGQVTGYSFTTGDSAHHAFLYTGTPGSGGAMADLGSLDGTTSSWGEAINASGQVAGFSGGESGGWHAFLYTGTPGVDGHMTDLDAWLDANNPTEGAKWMLRSATGLNDTGLITGIGSYNDGAGGLSDGTRAFILDASSLIPEPANLALLGLGAITLLRRRR